MKRLLLAAIIFVSPTMAADVTVTTDQPFDTKLQYKCLIWGNAEHVTCCHSDSIADLNKCMPD